MFLIAVAFCLQSKLLLYQSSLHCQTNHLGRASHFESVWGQHNICQLDPLSLLLSANTASSQKLSEALHCLLLSRCFFCFPFKKVVHTPRNDKNPHLPFLSLCAAHCGTVTVGKLRIKVGLKSEFIWRWTWIMPSLIMLIHAATCCNVSVTQHTLCVLLDCTGSCSHSF